MESFDIQNTYVHLTDGPVARPVEVGADFWQTLDQNEDLAGGRMKLLRRVAAFDLASNADLWDMSGATAAG